jgi:D(-)-tartrate dehydratase
MRIVDIRERNVPISRYANPSIPSEGLDTTVVAVITDVFRNGKPIVGFGFSSIGRFGQSGLIRDRFAPRLMAANHKDLEDESGKNFDPFRAWDCLMKGEKPGGHGDRCVAVGTLDMAIWDAASKIAEKPLHQFLAERLGIKSSSIVPAYVGGGYYFPTNEIQNLTAEVQGFLEQGYTHVKIKIGGRSLADDLERIEAVLGLLPGGNHLAVDAMNRYSPELALQVATALAPYQLRWFEDICDPLDFETQAQLARVYAAPIAAGEALFSTSDARNLIRYGGLRPERDVLLFDPAHCYGIPEYLRIIRAFEQNGWSRAAFQPHGGHLYSLHLAAALGLGGTEANPHNFQPFGGFADDARVEHGFVRPPDAPGIGFETRHGLSKLFHSLLEVA